MNSQLNLERMRSMKEIRLVLKNVLKIQDLFLREDSGMV